MLLLLLLSKVVVWMWVCVCVVGRVGWVVLKGYTVGAKEIFTPYKSREHIYKSNV